MSAARTALDADPGQDGARFRAGIEALAAELPAGRGANLSGQHT
ncbi:MULTISPECIES: hypothetical protein [Streptomyces]|uniref:Uncharacterized protein n=1 Tax=Streptomyces doudnae TaxID=3075536 RepID=A0ABD5EKF6_9ACTN|nr:MULTISPECIES: hypothetical protein [unclassified Streptomyces]MDT0435167.1 hypothetical protein [Streptomyces sp. DSM 41981]